MITYQETIRPSADLRNHYNEISKLCREGKEAVIITVNGRGDTVLEAAGFETYFTFLNNNNYGLNCLDCLNLQKLMTDSDFINDVCMACNAGGESPHVFPADSLVYERI